MSHRTLSEFEQTVLLALLHLEGDVYGVPLVEEIERRTGRPVVRAAVYVTLRRLEAQGVVSSHASEPTAERGGRARRCSKLEPMGLQRLREAGLAVDQPWPSLDSAVGR